MRRRMGGLGSTPSGDHPPNGQGEPYSAVPRGDRRTVEIRGFAMLHDGSRIPIALVNLSYDGCAIETPVPLEAGTRLRLATRVGELDAEVRWCSDNEAGLHFAKPSVQSHEAPAHIPREEDRVPVVLNARMKRFGRGGYDVPVADLSSIGCKVEFADRPDVDEAVSIKFEGIDSLEATVRWVKDRNCGLDFVHPVHPVVLDMLLHRNAGAA